MTAKQAQIVTEEMIASVLPTGEQRMASEILVDLDLTLMFSMTAFTGILKHMRDCGFLQNHERRNRAHLWYRLREPVITPPKDGQDRIGGFLIERVTVGGSDSGYYGTSQDKPTSVTLPKMPTLKSVEANA
jgi:hypothetical protein